MKYLLSAYLLPGTVLGAEETDGSKNHLHCPYLHGAHTLVEEPNSLQRTIQVCTCIKSKYQEEWVHGVMRIHKLAGVGLVKVVRSAAQRT